MMTLEFIPEVVEKVESARDAVRAALMAQINLDAIDPSWVEELTQRGVLPFDVCYDGFYDLVGKLGVKIRGHRMLFTMGHNGFYEACLWAREKLMESS
jgi:hypothetical protein